MKAELVKRKDRWDLYGAGGAKIASSLDWNTKLSIKNCQAIERGYDLDELADEWLDYNGHKWSNNDDTAGDNYGSFKAGFQKALELMGDKKFSEEDMLRAYNQGGNDGAIYVSSCEDYGSYEQIKKSQKESEQRDKEFIQSLRQTEWDVELVQEQGKDTFGNAELTWYNPKIDADGCFILKRAE